RAGTTHCRRVEAALLPDQTCEEIDRQIIFRRCRRKGITNVVYSGRRLGGVHRVDFVRVTPPRFREGEPPGHARGPSPLRVRPPGYGLARENGRRANGWPRGEKTGK